MARATADCARPPDPAVHPLTGLTVLDLTRLLPGAVCTLALAELGADVVKIEDPRSGDPLRHLPPSAGGRSVYDLVFNRGKRSVALDLRRPAARPVIDRLAARADVLVESFRPRTARRLGLDASSTRGRHPGLIHCAITGFGQTGPYADHPGHDINFVALAGLLALDRAPDQAPHMPWMLIADIAGGALSGLAGILAALVARVRTGQGATVDISMHEGALSWLAVPAARELVDGGDHDARDLPISGREACYNVYRTADDRFLALGALEPKFWAAFCERLGRPDFVPLQHAEGETQDRLVTDLRAILATRALEDWLTHFAGVEACLAPVKRPAEALADPHVTHRQAVLTDGSVRAIRTPIRVVVGAGVGGEAPARPLAAAPSLGADTDAVLAAAGFDAAARAALRADGVLG